MVLKVYGDYCSSLSRAVFAFCKFAEIPHEIVLVSMKAGEHKEAKFLEMNPCGLVPVIDDDGFVLYEITAILQYLATSRGLEDPWFPADPRKRQLVYRFNSWYQDNLRSTAALLPFYINFGENMGLVDQNA
jgi:glutathione S-transferase